MLRGLQVSSQLLESQLLIHPSVDQGLPASPEKQHELMPTAESKLNFCRYLPIYLRYPLDLGTHAVAGTWPVSLDY